MNLEEYYDKLWIESSAKFNQGKFKTDPFIDLASDTRRGITLLARPNESVKEKISKFTSELREIEPNQYYYSSSDIHVTVMSIISCYPEFRIENIDLSEFIKCVNQSLHNINGESIEFRGITASDSCIMLKGFPSGDMLNQTRENLRSFFSKSTLENTIDHRYSIKTAHSTVVRFKSKVTKKLKLMKILDKYRDFDFGTSVIENYELVSNDWYQRKDRTETLHSFKLKKHK